MGKFTVNEASQRLLNYAFKLSYLDLQAIGNGGQKTLFSLPAGSGILACVVQETVAVAGTTSLVIDVGTTGADPDEFIDALDVDAMSGPVANTGDSFVQSAGNTTIKGGALPVGLVAAATPVLLEVTDAAIASATAGEITVSFLVLDFSNI
jgi:hypothetical protein